MAFSPQLGVSLVGGVIEDPHGHLWYSLVDSHESQAIVSGTLVQESLVADQRKDARRRCSMVSCIRRAFRELRDRFAVLHTNIFADRRVRNSACIFDARESLICLLPGYRFTH